MNILDKIILAFISHLIADIKITIAIILEWLVFFWFLFWDKLIKAVLFNEISSSFLFFIFSRSFSFRSSSLPFSPAIPIVFRLFFYFHPFCLSSLSSFTLPFHFSLPYAFHSLHFTRIGDFNHKNDRQMLPFFFSLPSLVSLVPSILFPSFLVSLAFHKNDFNHKEYRHIFPFLLPLIFFISSLPSYSLPIYFPLPSVLSFHEKSWL